MPMERTTELGHERLTVSTTTVGLASIPQGATFALMRVKGGAICYRADGTAPTATTGMEAEDAEVISFDADLHGFQAIRRDASDVTLIVVYYRTNN